MPSVAGVGRRFTVGDGRAVVHRCTETHPGHPTVNMPRPAKSQRSYNWGQHYAAIGKSEYLKSRSFVTRPANQLATFRPDEELFQEK